MIDDLILLLWTKSCSFALQLALFGLPYQAFFAAFLSYTTAADTLVILLVAAITYMTSHNYNLNVEDVRLIVAIAAAFHFASTRILLRPAPPSRIYRDYVVTPSLTYELLAQVNLHMIVTIAIVLGYHHYGAKLCHALTLYGDRVSRTSNYHPLYRHWIRWLSAHVFEFIGLLTSCMLVASTIQRAGGIIVFVRFICLMLWAHWNIVLAMAFIGILGIIVGVRYLLVTERDGAPKRRVILGRKFFHVVALLIAIPVRRPEYTEITVLLWAGFIYLFMLEEICRIFNIGGLKPAMAKLVQRFSDSRDLESLIVTPLFLALGCEIPMAYYFLFSPDRYRSTLVTTNNWNKPVLARQGGSGSSKLLVQCISGIMATCVGDATSALIPNWCFRNTHRLHGNKTVEGLISFTLTHFIATWMIMDWNTRWMIPILTSSIAAALAETYTKRIDNYWVSIVAVSTIELFTILGDWVV